jgi:hypothetical protein
MEYYVLEEASQPGVLERRLNELGRQGWRVVGHFTPAPPFRVMLERESHKHSEAAELRNGAEAA